MEVRPKWTEEELDIIFSKAILVQDGLRKDAPAVLIKSSHELILINIKKPLD